MTVVFFARRFYPLIGGVEKHCKEVGKRLVNQGFKVTVITEKSPGLKIQEEVEGVKIIRINSGKDNWFKKFVIWKELLKNLKLINSADIIHCHDVFYWYLPFRFIFPLKKVYITFHGYEGNKIPTKKAIFMHMLAEKLSSGNICVGDFLKKWYGTNPTIVTYGAVDKSLIDMQSKVPSKDIMYLGRLEEEAGILKYLNAIKLLKESGKNYSMDVFGDGALLSKAKQYSMANNLKVNFKGFVQNPEKFIQDYKYIFVSRYLGVLEGLAAKRPVFAEFNNEIKEDYLKMTPFSKFIFIFNNPENLYKELKKGNTKSDGFNWVKNQTWDKLTSDYLKLWEVRQ